MTLVAEDGNGLPTANAYVDVAFADAYFTLRANAAWTAANTAAKEVAIVKATDYIDTVWGTRFLGTQAFISDPPNPAVDQALQFPRDTREVFVGNIDYMDVNYVYPSNLVVVADLTKPVVIPTALKKACCEYAVRALANALLVDPTVDPTGVAIAGSTQKVGPVESSVTYFNTGGISITQPYPAADLLLKPLLKASGRAIRG
jgi:hypothetical protein